MDSYRISENARIFRDGDTLFVRQHAESPDRAEPIASILGFRGVRSRFESDDHHDRSENSYQCQMIMSDDVSLRRNYN